MKGFWSSQMNDVSIVLDYSWELLALVSLQELWITVTTYLAYSYEHVNRRTIDIIVSLNLIVSSWQGREDVN